jgi:hypothetical protein
MRISTEIVKWSLENDQRQRKCQMIVCEWSQVPQLSNDRLWWDKGTEIVKWSLVNYHRYWNCRMIVCEWAKAPKLSNYCLWMSKGNTIVKRSLVNEQRYRIVKWSLENRGLRCILSPAQNLQQCQTCRVPLTPFSQLRLWKSLRILQGLGKKTKM